MAQIQSESESESCNLSSGDEEDLNAVAQIQSDLKGWCASSIDDFNAVETTREYKFSVIPNWTCIVCMRAIRRGSVFQCMQGHLACKSCSSKGTSCKACSNAVSRIKNLEIEKVMNATLATCKYATLGCTKDIKFKDLDESEHEKTCSFAPMACPMPECHQVGVKHLFSQHLLTKHDIDLVVDLYKNDYESFWRSSDFELDPTPKVVLLREINEEQRKHGSSRYNYERYELPTELHLLHQEVTEFYDKLHITPLTESSKRAYELEVKIDNGVTYSLKGEYGMQLNMCCSFPKSLVASLSRRIATFVYSQWPALGFCEL